MDDKIWVAIAGAGVAAIVKVAYDIWNGIRKAKLGRLNSQIENLYGPLRALGRASTTAWKEFRKTHRPPTAINPDRYFLEEDPPTQEELEAWILWMTEVFVPLHAQMERVIISNVHLVDEPAFPACFDELLAHIAGYKTAQAKWRSRKEKPLSAANRFQDYRSVLDYPADAFLTYVNETFLRLCAKQHRLLRPFGDLSGEEEGTDGGTP